MLGKLVETFANNDTSTCEARAIQVLGDGDDDGDGDGDGETGSRLVRCPSAEPRRIRVFSHK